VEGVSWVKKGPLFGTAYLKNDQTIYLRKRSEDMNKMVMVMKAKNGKTREAIVAVKAMVEYVRTKHDLKPVAYMQVLGGTSGTIYVIGEDTDAAGAQAATAKLMADEGYWALAQKLAEVTIDAPTMSFLQPI
jgi:hypothetical protein